MVNWATTPRNYSQQFENKCEVQPQLQSCKSMLSLCRSRWNGISFPVMHMTKYDEFKDVFLMAFCKGQAFACH